MREHEIYVESIILKTSPDIYGDDPLGKLNDSIEEDFSKD